jgi:valyl-tRNA synthetase
MAIELPKQYDPHDAQQRWLRLWDERKYWHSRPDPNREPFCIVIPPPNVTGALHLGHALNNTLQDILIRWRRMQGYNALWLPGTDHAGIATQAIVERRLREEEHKTRHDLGREALVARIWQWKDQYEARILRQLRELGCSCDWDRTRFTLDPGLVGAVRTTFFKMFRDGLIFRGKRLVNWDTQLQTSVADDETFHETVKGGFWTFKYPVVGTSEFIRFSTTRPETMLGDTAVAVHPSDERYKQLVGKRVRIPLVDREIPIIADGILAKPELGTGAVKVTPAHDFNDYACGVRNKLPMINILTPDGRINENGGPYAGMDRYQAREQVTADMEKLGLFEGREDRDIEMAHSDRSKTPIEPYLSDQWFVKMGDLAQAAMAAVEDDRVKFFPERYKDTYLDWLGEKRDWCISRQLWWGHRIPVWRKAMLAAEWQEKAEQDAQWAPFFLRGEGAEHVVTVQTSAETFYITGHRKYRDCLGDALQQSKQEAITWFVAPAPTAEGTSQVIGWLESHGFEQDPDVLDTWFSSALWPHSTLGWPEQTPELAYYYPTSVLVTNRDIITLWVARMVITGLYNVGKVPFHHVYIHPKILDGFGEGMSKSKGNGIDPLDIIHHYGTDALRYGMAKVATETQDSRMPVANICPHCGEQVPVRQEHMYLRTRKVTCPKCKKPFRPGGPWPAEDPELPTARQASERFEEGRNFANKLWNAARFLLLNLEGYTPGALRAADLPVEDRWILSRLTATVTGVTAALEGYHFSEAARLIYDFTWSEFCDWYVEMSKGRLKTPSPPTPLPGGERGENLPPSPPGGERGENLPPSPPGGEGSGVRGTVQRVLAGVLDAILRLAHPILPFVTESIWQALNEAAFERGLPAPEPSAESVMIASWPDLPKTWRDEAVEHRVGRMQELVRAVREVRSHYSIDPKKALDVQVRCGPEVAADFQSLTPFIAQLAGVGKLGAGPEVARPAQSASQVRPDFEAYVSLAGLIDVAAEARRLEKQLAEKKKHLQSTEAKLGNAAFVGKAPAEVVQQQRALVEDLRGQIAALEASLVELRQP